MCSSDLMTPFFTPDRADLAGFGVPKIFLAGVGELMTEVAGEVCDGFICHGFTTEKYLREVTIPALARGRAKAGKKNRPLHVFLPVEERGCCRSGKNGSIDPRNCDQSAAVAF